MLEELNTRAKLIDEATIYNGAFTHSHTTTGLLDNFHLPAVGANKILHQSAHRVAISATGQNLGYKLGVLSAIKTSQRSNLPHVVRWDELHSGIEVDAFGLQRILVLVIDVGGAAVEGLIDQRALHIVKEGNVLVRKRLQVPVRDVYRDTGDVNDDVIANVSTDLIRLGGGRKPAHIEIARIVREGVLGLKNTSRSPATLVLVGMVEGLYNVVGGANRSVYFVKFHFPS